MQGGCLRASFCAGIAHSSTVGEPHANLGQGEAPMVRPQFIVVLSFLLAVCVSCSGGLKSRWEFRRALLIDGNGLTGAAWTVGLLKGLHDAGIDLSNAALVVGTSRGAITATQLFSNTSLDALYIIESMPLGSGSLGPAATSPDGQYLLDTFRLWRGRVPHSPQVSIEVGRRAVNSPHPISESDWMSYERGEILTDKWPGRR